MAYEKKKQNNSQAAKHLEELRKLEGSARLAFTHLESQNRQLCELIADLTNDKSTVLNGIVGDYMQKSHLFHRKANQQFQTLSSIDAESHKGAALLQ